MMSNRLQGGNVRAHKDNAAQLGNDHNKNSKAHNFSREKEAKHYSIVQLYALHVSRRENNCLNHYRGWC